VALVLVATLARSAPTSADEFRLIGETLPAPLIINRAQRTWY
jgi:hypothetical protein